MNKIMTAEEAAKLIKDGDYVAITGSGGGLLEPTAVHRAVEARFKQEGHPRNITLIHATGTGDREAEGASRYAHEGMTKKVIGGHWGWSPQMQKLSNDCKIEAYNLPQGVMVLQYREIAAHRPGLITKIGMHTFVDPRVSGGKLNSATKEDLVEVVNFCGAEYLHYKPYPVHVGIIRGSVADEDGNISLQNEPALLEVLALAQAARNCGGKVICQVKFLAKRGSLDPRLVAVPGIMVDAVVVNPCQAQTRQRDVNPYFSGEYKQPMSDIKPMELNERKIVARRAAMELEENSVINLGFGMSDGVAAIAAEEGINELLTLTIEQGIIGGIPAGGDIFGVATNPVAILNEPSQFDFYHGNGLNLTCLGMAQIDRHGNVNVSKFGSRIAGCGGFIDISQTARKVIFCGTFTAKGHKKFVNDVEHITFSSRFARETGQQVLYVTERAVLRLSDEGLVLIEIAPGVDVEKDVLTNMDFKPTISPDLKIMDERIFRPEPMNIVMTRLGDKKCSA